MAALSHLFVHVRDLERARRFYVDYVGLEVLQEGGGYLRLGGSGGFACCAGSGWWTATPSSR